jgi:hypothetical protein
MNVEVITKDDLQAFRLQLINDLKDLLFSDKKTVKEWLRSSEVRKLLKISPGTLQNLRVTGKLKSAKIGGIHFYRYADIETMLSSKDQLLNKKQ